MNQSKDRFLTTHVGSLVRPKELSLLFERQREGEQIPQIEYDAALKKAVRAVVEHQAKIGIDILNDGEFGKNISWSRYILERLKGFERRSDPTDRSFAKATYGKDRRDFAEFYAEYDPAQGFSGMTGWAVTGPISYKGQADLQRDIDNLREATKTVRDVEVFFPAVAPASVAPDRKDEYYRTDEEYVYAVADALNTEYKAIVDAGPILQIDDSYFASYYDVIVPPGTLEDYRKWASMRIDALNHALRGIPEDRIRYHVCWGSWNGPHTCDVPMKDIADLMLRVKAQAYSIEMANPRHEHEWRVWETIKLPENKILLPGVISHATNIVEHPELVCERITRLARLVGRERVIASTDCGFSQGPLSRRLHPSIMWAKLEALVEGARLASKQMWR